MHHLFLYDLLVHLLIRIQYDANTQYQHSAISIQQFDKLFSARFGTIANGLSYNSLKSGKNKLIKIRTQPARRHETEALSFLKFKPNLPHRLIRESPNDFSPTG